MSAVNQPVGPTPVTATYGGNSYYAGSTVTGSVQVGPSQVSTTLTVAPVTGTYGTPVTLTGTLVNNYTNTPVPGETVTLKVNGTQSCTGTTNASGVATCTVTPTEPAGNYTVSGSFSGDTTTVPVLLASTGSNTFTETKAPTTLTYTGSTSVTSGHTPTLSATLTTAGGTPIGGQTVTFTVGTGSSAQRCSGTTNSAGNVELQHLQLQPERQPAAGDRELRRATATTRSSTTSASVTVSTPTSLSVGAATGTYGQSTTVTGTLTNAVNGNPISGQTITLTLNGSQSCTATTDQHGQGIVRHHAERECGDLHPRRLVRRQHGDLARPGGQHRLQPLRGQRGADQPQLHRARPRPRPASRITLTSELTSNGTALSGQPVTMTLGTGRSAQSCTATTTASGAASCTISDVNQVSGSVAVTVSYAGNGYYAGSSTSGGVSIRCGSGGGRRWRGR